jgi:hypothetical protein
MSSALPITGPDGRSYRPPRLVLVVGIVGTIVFAVAGIASVVIAWTNLDGSFAHPQAFADVAGVIWAGMTLIGVLAIRMYYRYELTITGRTVRLVGILRDREIDLSAVRRAAWRRLTKRGSLVLIGDDRRLSIDFGNFDRPDAWTIIGFFHTALPANVQENWERFRRYVAFETPAGSRPCLRTPETE